MQQFHYVSLCVVMYQVGVVKSVLAKVLERFFSRRAHSECHDTRAYIAMIAWKHCLLDTLYLTFGLMATDRGHPMPNQIRIFKCALWLDNSMKFDEFKCVWRGEQDFCQHQNLVKKFTRESYKSVGKIYHSRTIYAKVNWKFWILCHVTRFVCQCDRLVGSSESRNHCW